MAIKSDYKTIRQRSNLKVIADSRHRAPLWHYIFEALQQIEQKGYAKPYATDPRQVIRIGMNFSSVTRTIAEWKAV